MVRTAADMTVRQIISQLFDRVADELGVTADAGAGTGDPAAAQAGAPGTAAAAAAFARGGISGSVHVDDGEAGAEEAVIEEEDEEGGAGDGALRCAHLVFQVRACVGVGSRVSRASAVMGALMYRARSKARLVVVLWWYVAVGEIFHFHGLL